MKRVALIVGFGLFGALLGFASAALLLSLNERCGEPCAGEAAGTAMLTIAGMAIVFGLLAWCLSKAPRPRTTWLKALGGVTVAAYVAVLTLFAWRQHEDRAYLYSIREIQPSVDFSTAVIAREPVEVLGGANVLFTVRRHERCALGMENDEARPPTIEIECRAGIGSIRKVDRSKFEDVAAGS